MRLREVAEPTPRARRGPFVLLVVALVVGGLTCLLTLNTFSAADELTEQRIADANSATAAEVQALQVDLAARGAPAALARAATALGMVPATNPAFLQIGRNGGVTLLGVPAPVVAPPIPLQAPAAGSIALIPGVAATPPAAGATPTPAPTTAPTAAPTVLPTPTATMTLPGGAR